MLIISNEVIAFQHLLIILYLHSKLFSRNTLMAAWVIRWNKQCSIGKRNHIVAAMSISKWVLWSTFKNLLFWLCNARQLCSVTLQHWLYLLQDRPFSYSTLMDTTAPFIANFVIGKNGNLIFRVLSCTQRHTECFLLIQRPLFNMKQPIFF